MNASVEFKIALNKSVESIKKQMARRCYRAANELRNASVEVLRHAGSGRVYHGHVASAPGEPPAPDKGTFMKSWQASTLRDGTRFISRIETNVDANGHNLGAILEYGTSKMALRPHHEKIVQAALPKIKKIYSEPYL